MSISSKHVSIAGKQKKENFLRELQKELKKVSWTSKEELKVFTKIVLLATLFFGFGIYLIDLILRSGLNVISFIFRIIFG
jgi:preprotein translocase subunit SecE